MNTLTTRCREGGLALWLAAMKSMPAAAHHSVAMFDQSKHAEFSGTVAKLLWANPHVWLYVTVERQGSAPEIWGFEAGGTNMLIRMGWNAADVKQGDKITVVGHPERSGQHLASLEEVRLSDGRVLKVGLPAVLSPGGAPPGGAPPSGAAPGGAPPAGSPPGARP